MRAKRDLFRSLTLAAMVDSASRMCRGLPLPSLQVAASYIRTYDGRDNLRAARTPKYVSFPSLVVVVVSLSFRSRLVHASLPWLTLCRCALRRFAYWAGLDRPSPRVRHRLRCSLGLAGHLRHRAAASRPQLATYSLPGGFIDLKISAPAWPASVKIFERLVP